MAAKSHSNVGQVDPQPAFTGDDYSRGYPDCMVDGWLKCKAPVQLKQKKQGITVDDHGFSICAGT